jgi:hypothetical protein
MRLINKAVATRVPQCSMCHNRRYNESRPLVSFVMSPGGVVLCNYCAVTHLDADLEEALAVSRVHDIYRILAGATPGQSEVEYAGNLSKHGWQLTHLHGHVGGPAVAAAMMKPPSRARDYDALHVLLLQRLPQPPEEIPEVQQHHPRLKCSFCRRGQRDTLLRYYSPKEPGNMAITLCADCLIVACQLLRKHGCLPEVRVEYRVHSPDMVVKWSAFPLDMCHFCGSLRDDDMLLTGPDGVTICFRCVAALLKQVRDDERHQGHDYPGVTVQDYSFMSAEDLRTRTKDILKGGARWYPLTWIHKRKDAISTSMYRSSFGIRVRVCTDMMPPPQAWITKDAPTERPPTDSSASFHLGMPRKPMSRRCAFCWQGWENVPGLGRSRQINAPIPDAGALVIADRHHEICYECIVLANDTFERDGSVLAPSSAAEENAPVVWTPIEK